MTYVFDIDGTLVDSFERHITVLKDAMHSCNIEIKIDGQEYINYKCDGNNNKLYLRNVLHMSDRDIVKVCKIWELNIEREEYTILDSLYSDTKCVLERISEKADIYYLSARNNSIALLNELERFGISEYPKDIIIVSPQNALTEKTEALCKLKSSHSHPVWMIGDTEVDYMAAQKSGCEVYIVHRGFRSAAFWSKFNIETQKDLYGLNYEESIDKMLKHKQES